MTTALTRACVALAFVFTFMLTSTLAYAQSFTNPSFETPTVSGITAVPSSSGWTGYGTHGLIPSSVMTQSGYPGATSGNQLVYFAASSGIRQTVHLDPGTYTIDFKAMGQGGYTGTKIRVLMNGNVIGTTGTLTPVAWATFAVSTTIATAGNYEFDFTMDPSTSGYVYLDEMGFNPLTVNLTAPANSASYTEAQTITLTATATTTSGAISKVEFFDNGVLIAGSAVTVATPSTSPAQYTFAWTDTTPGTHNITARATGSTGSTLMSAAAAITVSLVSGVNRFSNPSFEAPVVSGLTAIASTSGWTAYGTNGLMPSSYMTQYGYPGATHGKQLVYYGASSGLRQTIHLDPGTYTIAFKAMGQGGYSGTKVLVKMNGTAIGTTGALTPVAWTPFSVTASIATAGNYEFDFTMDPATSGYVYLDDLRVTAANAPPTISLTTPSGSVYAAPGQAVTLTATATDSDGSVSKVEFLNGGSLISGATVTTPTSGTSPPQYTFVWTAPASGVHTITAKATDNHAATATTASATVTINQPPTVNWVTPTSATTVAAGQAIVLTASATDSDGSVSKVEFLANGYLIDGATITNPVPSTTPAQYTFSWSGAATGAHQVLARVTDNNGATSITGAVTVTFAQSGTAALHYIHADHLGTLRVITKASNNAIVWKNDNTEPFGNSAPNENPSSLGTFKYNLRFPGQLYDPETNTSYNYFRDYDAVTGRYIQSDPIGLTGGLSTFAYAGNKPLSNIDPTGEIFFVPLLGLGAGTLLADLAVIGGVGWGISNSVKKRTAANTTTTTSGTDSNCCPEMRRVYEANEGKRGKKPRQDGYISAEPTNGQQTLDVSYQSGPRRRIGYDFLTGEYVVFHLHLVDEKNCIEYWHGFVVTIDTMNRSDWRAAKDAGLPGIPRKPPV